MFVGRSMVGMGRSRSNQRGTAEWLLIRGSCRRGRREARDRGAVIVFSRANRAITVVVGGLLVRGRSMNEVISRALYTIDHLAFNVQNCAVSWCPATTYDMIVFISF